MSKDGLDTDGMGQRNVYGPQFSFGMDGGATPFVPGIGNPSSAASQPYAPFPVLNLQNYGGYAPFNIPSAVTGSIGEFGAPPQFQLSQAGGSDIQILYYDTSGASPVLTTVSQPTSVLLDGSVNVTDDGNGNLTAVFTGSGTAGTLTASPPLAQSGSSFSSSISLALSYDSTNSFASTSPLTLKTITVTAPTSLGVVSDMTVDTFGRVTAYTKQWMGWYKISSSVRIAGNAYWAYSLERQESKATWPFMQTSTTYDGANPLNITAYNLEETANTGTTTANGYNISSVAGTGDLPLTDYTGYYIGAARQYQFVQVWKIGSVYFFSANNFVYGTCP